MLERMIREIVGGIFLQKAFETHWPLCNYLLSCKKDFFESMLHGMRFRS